MKKIYVVADNVVSPLGWTTDENFSSLLQGHSGIRLQESVPAPSGDANTRSQAPNLLSSSSFQASLFNPVQLEEQISRLKINPASWTRFEKIVLLSVSDALSKTSVRLDDPETAFILSTTKGNIELLNENSASDPRLLLHHTARKVAAFFQQPNNPTVVTHACVSGLAAILLGRRMLQSGLCRHVVMVGADTVSRFVLSGFQSLQALSDEPCRPYDLRRKGLNLGEGAATVVLSLQAEQALDRRPVRVLAGAMSNDANHISGPSRTGLELSQTVNRALEKSGLQAADLDFISAHGTATLYNDEMEAKAFGLSDLSATPLHSLKGYFGHTLGAAGLIESVMAIQSLRSDTVLPTRGFEALGVSQPLKVCKQGFKKKLNFCLKTASGFGGCNAALIFKKNE